MGGGGDSDAGDSTTTVSYPPYLEEHHKTFLDLMGAQVTAKISASPYSGWSEIEYACGFFGSGYTLCSFPSLYDMYGKFMAGLDVENLFTHILDDSINNVAINTRVSRHGSELSDDIESNALPRLSVGMRNINAVASSSYIVARELIEEARVKALNLYDAELRVRMLPVAVQRFGIHLEWNSKVIATYIEMMKLYFIVAMDYENMDYEMRAKDALWPFTVLDNYRAAIGALTGAGKTVTDVQGGGPSTAQKALGGALTGAAAGGMMGGWVGAGIGAAVGLASAFL